jgi:hypothetical protein
MVLDFDFYYSVCSEREAVKRKGAVTKAPGRPEGCALLAAALKVAAAAASTRLAVSA